MTDSFVDHRDEDTVYYETSALLLPRTGVLPISSEIFYDFVNNLCRSVYACDDLNQLHNR